MPDYPYLASVIVPVYNVEKYVRGCLESLVNQTLDFSKIEVVIVNDGTKDFSEEICREFSDKYENVVLYSKENEGLSKTRNYGLDRAHGKYIFFLDSDDKLRNDTIEAVTSFFETVYDETDLVTYRDTQYIQSRPKLIHYRYMTLKKSGIYDLNDPKNRFITQTRVNVCVKNLGENNPKFDFSPNFRHEDEEYCCKVVREKMKIGYCDRGEYLYNVGNSDSIVATSFSPDKIFESSMLFYEQLFDSFYGLVPLYFQGVIFNDFRWKLMKEIFLPYHLDGEEWLTANRRIDALLRRMDEDTIVLHPSIKENHISYWLLRRKKGHPAVVADENSVTLYSSGKRIFSQDRFKINFTEKDGVLFAEVKSTVFYFLNKKRYEITVNGEKADIVFSNDYLDKNFNPEGNYPMICVPDKNAKITVKIDGIGYNCIL